MLDDAPSTLALAEDRDETRTRERPEWLCCRVCGRRIVLAASRVSFDGGHTHQFRNPSGLAFRIGLFDEAPGCSREAEPTEFFSWFPGYAWRLTMCGGCRAHLGWAFECVGPPGAGEPAGFDGLILDRLAPES